MKSLVKDERIALNKRKYAVYAQYRAEKGYSDYYISKLLNIPPSTIYEWSYGHSCPKTETMLRICAFLGMPLDAVMFGEPKDG